MTYLLMTLAIAAAALEPLQLRAAEVSPTDPVPNDGGADDGIGYHWTVKMGVKDSATVHGAVGAWSWDEDAFPDTAKGWTHTSNWIALELTQEARLTLILRRKAGIPVTVTMSNPDGVALFDLFPGFSIYKGWQDSGADSHNFNNRGDIGWAADVTYYTHMENDGSHSISGTFRLPAGKYSIAMGGNSPSIDAEGRQGYEALLTTDYPTDASELIVRGGNHHLTSRRSFTIKGRISNPESAKKLYVKSRARSLKLTPRGKSFATTVRRLKDGRNRVRLTLLSQEGTSRDTKIVLVDRVAPTPPMETNGLNRTAAAQ